MRDPNHLRGVDHTTNGNCWVGADENVQSVAKGAALGTLSTSAVTFTLAPTKGVLWLRKTVMTSDQGLKYLMYDYTIGNDPVPMSKAHISGNALDQLGVDMEIQINDVVTPTAKAVISVFSFDGTNTHYVTCSALGFAFGTMELLTKARGY